MGGCTDTGVGATVTANGFAAVWLLLTPAGPVLGLGQPGIYLVVRAAMEALASKYLSTLCLDLSKSLISCIQSIEIILWLMASPSSLGSSCETQDRVEDTTDWHIGHFYPQPSTAFDVSMFTYNFQLL